MLGIAGARSTIAQEVIDLLPFTESVHRAHLDDMPIDLDHYLICTGYLAGKQLRDLTMGEALRTWVMNFVHVAQLCDRIFEANKRARVLLMGSESGYRGSFDMAYAGAKAALHLYVETKRLGHPGQFLAALAPHIIADSGMTRRRVDYEATIARGAATRLGRWISARECAEVAIWALYDAPAFSSNTIIRLGDGNAN